MTPIDTLARNICWLGFANPKAVGLTKAQYWKGLTKEVKQEYRKEARNFVWLYDNLPMDWMGPLSFRVPALEDDD